MLNSHPQIGISFLAVAAFVGAICAFLLPVETKDREMEVNSHQNIIVWLQDLLFE